MTDKEHSTIIYNELENFFIGKKIMIANHYKCLSLLTIKYFLIINY